MAASAARQESQAGLRKNERKWTPTLMNAGWIALPNVIVEHQQQLGLDPVDINILLHLLRYWWDAENLPHPSKGSIASCIGVDPSTVRRHVAAMEAKGLIRRIPRSDAAQGQKANHYEFTGLIEAARPLALEALRIREERRAEDARRRARRRPRVVGMDD